MVHFSGLKYPLTVTILKSAAVHNKNWRQTTNELHAQACSVSTQCVCRKEIRITATVITKQADFWIQLHVYSNFCNVATYSYVPRDFTECSWWRPFTYIYYINKVYILTSYYNQCRRSVNRGHLNRQEWHQRVPWCIYMETGRIKIKATTLQVLTALQFWWRWKDWLIE